MRKAVPRDGFFYTLIDMKKTSKATDKKVVPYTATGAVLGVLIGVLTDNISLWLPIGLAIGTGVGYAQIEKK